MNQAQAVQPPTLIRWTDIMSLPRLETSSSQRWRAVLWITVVALWLLPALAMQLSDEVNWSVGDFLVFGVMLAVAGGLCELALRQSHNQAYRLACVVVIGAGFLLVWANLAVGLIGDEGHPANLMYFGVLGIGLAGALRVKLRAAGLAQVMLAMAFAQSIAMGVALALGERHSVALSGFWLAAWLMASALFRHAARGHAAEVPNRT